MNNQLDGEGGREGLAGLASTSQHRGNNLSSNSLPCIPQTNNDIPPSAQEQNRAQAQIPLPQHFIVRPSLTKHTASGTVTIPGPIVPLVAVDQLPEWFELSGVPRELNLEQTVGLTNLGTAVRDPEFYTVRMRSDPETTSSTMSPDRIAMVTPTSRERRPGQMDQMQQTQQQQRRGITVEDTDNGRLIPVDMSATPLLGSYMDPAAMSFTDGGHHSVLDSRARVSSGAIQATNNTDIRTERQKTGNNNNSPHQQPPSTANVTLGIRPRLPSPTATGSTPPGSSNPYPILHHYPHPQHHHDLHPPYPLAPPPSPQHPADRMLQSWYHPLHPSSHHKPTSSASIARQKSNPSGPSSSSGGGSERPSIYCRHWCHRGTCRWGTACRYAHAMPATHEGLREVGLAHHPAWWTAAMNIGLAYGSGGFGGGPGFGLGLGGAWYPPRHYGLGGGNRKAQKDREREREKERELKEKGSREKESAGGKGKGVVVEDKNGGGAVLDIRSKKKDTTAAAAEAKIGGAVGDQKQKKAEQPQKEQKLVEI
ncbi:hypothetical protein F5Y13DRAFT_44682 [Hypoxylon sp. FL1857]|nr:hypothetical protein F5Y13DRAFT_44682 [Hypoxylon sp. FL1857]